jgi:glycosyltransferase involved in cell wall biosynthesis
MTGSGEPTRLLYVVNVGWFFVSHRLPLAIAARDAGYEVHVATALDRELDAGTRSLLESKGLVVHELRFSRSGSNPFELLRDFLDLIRLYWRLRPGLVHLVALKPMLLGGMAAKLVGVQRVILAVPGRGSVFSARGLLAALRRSVVTRLYRLAYRRGANRVIIQNAEDRDYFLARRVFAADDIRLIRGSGADISRFKPAPEMGGVPVVVFASRMLKEKGAEDFVAAARLLKGRGVEGRFVLVGDPDPGNPHSHTRAELQAWADSGVVDWWGHRADIGAVFAGCHVVCLPTFYGEGVPKVLIEAAACGRAIVTTDQPGCRDIVRHDYNGLLVPARDVDALAAALERLLRDRALREQMGARGRALVEADFSLDIVVRQTLEIYRELLA